MKNYEVYAAHSDPGLDKRINKGFAQIITGLRKEVRGPNWIAKP